MAGSARKGCVVLACDVEDGGEGLGDLDRELDGGGAQLHGRVQAPRITRIVVPWAVQSPIHLCFGSALVFQ